MIKRNSVTKVFLALTILASTNIAAFKIQKVIYGEDNREEVIDYPDSLYREYAKSVASQVSNRRLLDFVEGEALYSARTLSQSARVCKKERFSDQPTLPGCTGFLVGKDILVTAGHCMKSEYDCKNKHWVFDYQVGSYTSPKRSIIGINPKNVYTCKGIIEQSLKKRKWDLEEDYAIIRLDRPVQGRTPLKFRTRGKITRNSDVLVIGNPSGLPLKISDDAKVIKTWGKTFNTNLDTFAGNSGSPVFNLKSGLVEGILISGAQDYRYYYNGHCSEVNYASEMQEKVFKITKVKKLKKMLKAGKL